MPEGTKAWIVGAFAEPDMLEMLRRPGVTRYPGMHDITVTFSSRDEEELEYVPEVKMSRLKNAEAEQSIFEVVLK